MQWNQPAVDRFLFSLSTGFAPPPTAHLLAGGVILVLLGLPYILATRLGRRRRLRDLESRMQMHMEDWATQAELSPSELALVRELGQYLPEEHTTHLLLKEPLTFEAARRLMIDEHPERSRDLRSLAIRLGFRERAPGRTLRDTSDLPAGSLLFDAEGNPVVRILSLEPGHLEAETLPGIALRGRRLSLTVSRPDGLYALQTEIIHRKDHRLLLGHAVFERRQARRFFRKPLIVPASLGGVECQTGDLSGGGARLRMPTRALAARFSVDDLQTLVLRMESAEIRCTARIVHVVPEELFVHVAFERIREGDRDRIVRAVLKPERLAG